jgi:hypothetical protein
MLARTASRIVVLVLVAAICTQICVWADEDRGNATESGQSGIRLAEDEIERIANTLGKR